MWEMNVAEPVHPIIINTLLKKGNTSIKGWLKKEQLNLVDYIYNTIYYIVNLVSWYLLLVSYDITVHISEP